MNAHKSKLLFKSIVCPPVCFCPLIGCVLIPPPLGFLTTFFVQNLKFSKSFHMNPELEVIKLFWICKMTNTRRSYNCTFALLNRESVWTGRVLIPPPLGLFRVKCILKWALCTLWFWIWCTYIQTQRLAPLAKPRISRKSNRISVLQTFLDPIHKRVLSSSAYFKA